MIRVNNTKNEAEIYISGDIVDDSDGDFITYMLGDVDGYQWPAAIKKQLDSIDKNQPLTVYINSNGGSVPAGMAIANMISRHKGHTKAVVDGWACSIATQIFFAADERCIPENAYLMIHKPSTCVGGNANDLREVCRVLDVLQEGIEATYRAAALDGVSDEDIHAMVEAETWLTGTEAAKYFSVTLLPTSKAAAHAGKSFNRSMAKLPNGIVFADDTELSDLDQETSKKKAFIALAIAEGELIK